MRKVQKRDLEPSTSKHWS